MFKADEIALFAELFTKDGFCHLNHGPDITEQIRAVDYLIIPIGKDGEVSDELTIPICEHCLEGFIDPEWLLVLCFDCISSQWLARSKARLSYINEFTGQPYKVIIVNGCPKCSNKLNGIWFM